MTHLSSCDSVVSSPTLTNTWEPKEIVDRKSTSNQNTTAVKRRKTCFIVTADSSERRVRANALEFIHIFADNIEAGEHYQLFRRQSQSSVRLLMPEVKDRQLFV